jgi:pyruvate/2-oxoglutarate/acetoin dehydrogenase E1 component
VEVVDPRSLVPLDTATLVGSVSRTHRVVIVEEGPLRGGVGGHLAWVLMREAFDELDAPIERVAAPNVPVPFAPVLEAAVGPQVAGIVAAVRRTVGLGP